MKTPYECYVCFNALKMHFNNDAYDYFKYNGKIKANPTSFQKRSDKFAYNKLTDINNLEDFLVPIIINNPKIWIGNILDNLNVNIANEWIKRKEARSYFFKEDLAKIEDLKKSIKPLSKNEFPKLLKQFINNDVGIDTLVILDNLIDFIKKWDILYKDSPLYYELIHNVKKASKFITYNRSSIIDIIRKHIKE